MFTHLDRVRDGDRNSHNPYTALREMGEMFINIIVHTASPKVLKIFSHPQTRDQSQVVQNDKLSQESVETKIFVGGNGTFSHFFEKKLKKMWKKISKKIFFFTKICFSELEKAYVQLFVLNFFLSRSWKT